MHKCVKEPVNWGGEGSLSGRAGVLGGTRPGGGALVRGAFVQTPHILTGRFPRLLEIPGFFSLKFPGRGKSWKMSLVLESLGNQSLRFCKVLKFTCGSN